MQSLQELLGKNVAADGIMGNQTLGVLADFGPEDMRELIEAYCEKRWNWMKTLKTFATFGKGWTRRVMGEQIGVQDADTGVIDRAVKLFMGAKVSAPTRAAEGKALEDDTKATVKVAEGFNLNTVGTVAAGVATLAAVAGATQYRVCWLPVFSVFCERPSENQDSSGNTHSWQTTWQEA